jgi:hypothetical protein
MREKVERGSLLAPPLLLHASSHISPNLHMPYIQNTQRGRSSKSSSIARSAYTCLLPQPLRRSMHAHRPLDHRSKARPEKHGLDPSLGERNPMNIFGSNFLASEIISLATKSILSHLSFPTPQITCYFGQGKN